MGGRFSFPVMITTQEPIDRVRRDLGRAYRGRMRADGILVLLGHGSLLALVLLLIHTEERSGALWMWAAAVGTATLLRSLWMRSADRSGLADAAVLRRARLIGTAQALAWSLGAALLMPSLPMADLSIVLMVLAGIGAGSIATMAADAPSLYGFLAALSIPLPFGILIAGTDRPHLVATGVVVVFVAVMLLLYQRAHDSLVENTRVTMLLGMSQETQAALIVELQETLARVKTLTGLLPMCANCKKIRDDQGYWNNLEQYLIEHSDAVVSHGLCPDCQATLFPGTHVPEESPT